MAENQITSAYVSQKTINNFLFKTLAAWNVKTIVQGNLITGLMQKRNVKKAKLIKTVVGYACKMQSQTKMADTHSFPDLLLQIKIHWL